MNAKNREFHNSQDAWLTEQLFAHLKDLNAEKDKSAAAAGNVYNWQEEQSRKTTQRLESFDLAFRPQHLSHDFDISSETEALDLSSTGAAARNSAAQILDLTATVPIVPPLVVAKAVALNLESATPVSFETDEDELKLLKFLETQPKTEFIDSKLNNPTERPSTAYRIVKCFNCSGLFDITSFQAHICEYDEHQKLISSQLKATFKSLQKSPTKEPLLPKEPACIRLLRENQIRIRRFLKDELKYDVNASTNNSNTTTSTGAPIANNNTPSVSSNSSATNITAKKPDGPHECTLCDRKFVHASGLLRHMEKHAMDLIPTSTGSKTAADAQGNSFQSVNGLRVVIKCTTCGRIFFEVEAAFKHLCTHFPSGAQEEKELDLYVDEIQYESFVDDAMKYLQIEAKSSSSESFTYQEDKPPVYLKIVILNCILQCEFCDFVFSEEYFLFLHSACHLPERRFECFSCDIQMRTSKEVCTHWQAECVFMRENLKMHRATTQRYFVCNVCDNKFQSLDLLHEHRYTAYHFFPRLNKFRQVLQLPCEYCDMVFEYGHELVSHYEEKHYKKYKRDKDGTGSSGKLRQYLCDVCGKSYTQSSHLWQHLRFHQGVRPFACKEPGCSRKFTIRPDLNDHIRKCHTGERPYHCLVCDKRFLTGSVFYQHRLIHRGERRYECEECGKRFYRADALKNHQRIHTGEKPFGCLFCTKNFRQRGDRDKHMRARHSHLDANARLMMQMQKLQLEAAAAAAAEQVVQKHGSGGVTTVDGQSMNPNEVVMIGNVAFPKSMFESMVPDIDEESALKALQQLQ